MVSNFQRLVDHFQAIVTGSVAGAARASADDPAG